jgi:hypothetical protein
MIIERLKNVRSDEEFESLLMIGTQLDIVAKRKNIYLK